ncbi:hypothetical protein QTN25_003936 [Entamoeba marina]
MADQLSSVHFVFNYLKINLKGLILVITIFITIISVVYVQFNNITTIFDNELLPPNITFTEEEKFNASQSFQYYKRELDVNNRKKAIGEDLTLNRYKVYNFSDEKTNAIVGYLKNDNCDYKKAIVIYGAISFSSEIDGNEKTPLSEETISLVSMTSILVKLQQHKSLNHNVIIIFTDYEVTDNRRCWRNENGNICGILHTFKENYNRTHPNGNIIVSAYINIEITSYKIDYIDSIPIKLDEFDYTNIEKITNSIVKYSFNSNELNNSFMNPIPLVKNIFNTIISYFKQDIYNPFALSDNDFDYAPYLSNKFHINSTQEFIPHLIMMYRVFTDLYKEINNKVELLISLGKIMIQIFKFIIWVVTLLFSLPLVICFIELATTYSKFIILESIQYISEKLLLFIYIPIIVIRVIIQKIALITPIFYYFINVLIKNIVGFIFTFTWLLIQNFTKNELQHEITFITYYVVCLLLYLF